MITKCLFPAAGYGTRFLPATKVMPKEMLPICTKPLIQYGVEEAIEAGIHTMAIVTGRGKRTLEDHFDVSYELEHQIRGTTKEKHLADIRDIIDKSRFVYTRQRDIKGLGHAVLTGRHLIGDEPFAVVLADDLCVSEGKGVLKQMTELYKRELCVIVAVMEVSPKETSAYGIVAGEWISDELLRARKMVEKPAPEDAPSNLAVIGRYILTPQIFDVLQNQTAGAGGEIQLTDAINAIAKHGKVLAYRFKGTRYDCGSLDGFVAATNAIYRQYKAKAAAPQ
ncbi:MAG: UTP--glucose-1-phosphate uridylyltransferase GalU [Helicobacteraceae bacterium]|jgi:UTP--glucose-1-phosphate uridylyltransferase|nr:UTP--glucose-1-phosphate uridylyltransferase GalU [Helicobacteraceae bacterium]